MKCIECAIILILIIFVLFSRAGVCASDTEDMIVQTINDISDVVELGDNNQDLLASFDV